MMYKIAAVLAFGFLQACGSSSSDDPLDEELLLDEGNISPSVAVVSTSPADRQNNIALNAEIKITFNDQIEQQSLSNTTVLIRDNSGQFVKAVFDIENDYRTMVITREIYANARAWDPSKTYQVFITRGVRDRRGQSVGSYFFRFSTINNLDGQGIFKVKQIGPDGGDGNFLTPRSGIRIEFSEPLDPGREVCSRTYWANSVKIYNGDLGLVDQKASITQVQGEYCIECTRNNCNVLVFHPLKTYEHLSAVRVVLEKDDRSLRGLSSGDPLAKPIDEWFWIL